MLGQEILFAYSDRFWYVENLAVGGRNEEREVASIPKDSLEKLLFLRREMDRLFRDFFDPHKAEVADNVHTDVSLDVFETPDAIILEAELPGMSRENIELSVLRDVIVIEGQKPKATLPAKIKFHCMERNFGRFRRVIEIPGVGDTRLIKAEYSQGILRVRLPKIKERRGHRQKIPIE
jgi:HSP20 family protein